MLAEGACLCFHLDGLSSSGKLAVSDALVRAVLIESKEKSRRGVFLPLDSDMVQIYRAEG